MHLAITNRSQPLVNRQYNLYGKKRGNRRTGSGRLGNAALLAFFATILVAGGWLLVSMVTSLVLPEWRVNHRFIASRGLVLMKRIGESRDETGPVHRPEILLRYQANGRPMEHWCYPVTGEFTPGEADKIEALRRYQVGQEYACWYDPLQPETVVLVRGYTWYYWLMLLVPLTLIIVGGGGLTYRLINDTTSAERRAAMARRVSQLDLFDRQETAGDEFPAVPSEVDLTNSPGTRLTYRLPLAVTAASALLVLAASCLVVNGVVAVFVTIAVNSYLQGEPEWFLTLFLVPFAAFGIGLAYYTIRQLLVTMGVGPTLVEISAHPLHPGESCEVFLAQSGRLRMNSLKMFLICQEQATFQEGTNTRTETCLVHEQELFSRENFQIKQGAPLEVTAELRVPPGAMHSFRATHNEIKWKLTVKGDVANWPDYTREFPLLVYPADNGQNPP